MDNALKNLFAVTDLRNRVLFTLGLLGVYRVGGVVPTPGREHRSAGASGRADPQHDVRAVRHVLRQNLAQMTIFALGVMPYISASIILQLLTVVWPALERISKEGRAGAPQDHAVHAIPDPGAGGGAVARHRLLPRAPDADRRRAAARLRPGLGLPLPLRPDDDDRHDVRDVAGRADYRAWHRQRHVAADLRRHRRRSAVGCADDPRSDAHGPDQPAPHRLPAGHDGRWSSERSSSWSAVTVASRSSTRSGWSAGVSTAVRARTSR